MHGLVNKSFQCFVRDTYGPAVWSAVARKAQLGFDAFEAMLKYDPALTDRVIDAAATVLKRPREALLEDLGTFLVCNPSVESLRRLLRFGGVTFVDFLHSLDDLPDRGRLALPHLNLPVLELTDHGPGAFALRCASPIAGGVHVMAGLLRAMADDYGALVLLDIRAGGAEGPAGDVIAIQLLDPGFAAGRPFDLSAVA